MFVLGPIVGECAADRACILYESDVSWTVTITCVYGIVHLDMPPSDGSTPQRVVLRDLVEATTYHLCWTCAASESDEREFRHSFRTLDTNETPQIIFLSCNFLENRGNTTLWESACQDLSASGVTVAVHMGDQIYGDESYWNAMDLIK